MANIGYVNAKLRSLTNKISQD